jgi:hypothetical protein
MFAYSYPILGVFWTMLEFFLLLVWFWLLVVVFGDIFRSRDLSGFSKALWTIFVIILPYLGVFVYLIARGGGMHERSVMRAEHQDQAFRTYVQDVTGGSGSADQLANLADLKDRGSSPTRSSSPRKPKSSHPDAAPR